MRFLKIPAFLVAVVAATSAAAWAYLAPAIFALVPPLAQEAADLHNYLHGAHPGTLSGFASHDYDVAMDDLDFELFKLSVGVSTEAQVLKLNKQVKSSFNTFKKTLALEGLMANDPTLKSMWKHIEGQHYILQTWFKASPVTGQGDAF